MKPRIAYILKMYPRFSETFIVNEILELERRGMDIRIYSLRKPDDGRFHAALARVKANVIYVPQHPEMEADRIRSAHLRLQATRPESYLLVHNLTKKKGHPFAIKRFLQAGYIASHLVQHPVDGIHAHFASSATRVANLVGRLTELPYSFTAHAKDIFHQDVVPASLREKMRQAQFVVTVSEYNKRYLESLLDGETADIRTLYNGIDLNRFKPRPVSGGRENLILSVGRLVEKKGFEVLVRACDLLRHQGTAFRCEIIGSGPEEERIKAVIADFHLQDQIQLLGPKTQDAVRRAYHRAAVFALPCVVGQDDNRDGLPTVLLEAMATGLPVISTRLTGVPEIIDHPVNGLLVEPGDVDALAQALTGLLADPVGRQAMGAAARRKAQTHFNVRSTAGTLYSWLSSAKIDPAAEPGIPFDEIEVLHSLPSPLSLEEIFAAL